MEQAVGSKKQGWSIPDMLAKFFSKYLPDAFVIAIVLGIIVFIAGWAFTDASSADMVNFFGHGFSNLYKFGMQMCLILITGHALANTRVVHNLLKSLSSIPKNPTQAVVFTVIACMILNYLNWGLGMIGGAILARQVAANNRKCHYPLLIALVYGATITRGFSTSIPLLVATPGHFLEKDIGIIPITETLYSSWNIVITIGLVILLALLGKLMMPAEENVIPMPEDLIIEDEKNLAESAKQENLTPAQRFSKSRTLALLLATSCLIYCVFYFTKAKSFNININIVIILFLAIGLYLHGNLLNYKKAFIAGVGICSGVILQFPIYAGIMAMIKDSHLAAMIAQWFVSISDAGSFPIITYISASVLNVFVPSGGGQWAVQGPIMMPAAAHLGADTAKTIMGLAWGDALTNQIQPFWALPILGVAGLEVKDIMGYCAAWCLVAGLFIGAVLLFM